MQESSQKKIILLIIVIVILGGAYVGVLWMIGNSADPPHVCPFESDPVCGDDGITYLNACLANSKQMAIAHVGSCVSDQLGEGTSTTLSAEDRQYLFWLLRQRDDAGLPSVPIRHVKTEEQQDGSHYFYEWSDPETTIEIIAADGAVLQAVDSRGFDYVQ